MKTYKTNLIRYSLISLKNKLFKRQYPTVRQLNKFKEVGIIPIFSYNQNSDDKMKWGVK